MADKLLVELHDEEGNIYYLHTDASIVFCEDGQSVADKLVKMKGATATAAGASGFVPAPAAGAQGKYLCGDGTWQTPTDNTKIPTANIVQNATTAATDKVPSAAVAKDLQDQITQQNTKIDKSDIVTLNLQDKNYFASEGAQLFALGNCYILQIYLQILKPIAAGSNAIVFTGLPEFAYGIDIGLHGDTALRLRGVAGETCLRLQNPYISLSPDQTYRTIVPIPKQFFK